MKSTREKDIQVHCPYCSQKRLFDCEESSQGIVKIKCPTCKSIVYFNLQLISEQHRRKRLEGYCKIARTLQK